MREPLDRQIGKSGEDRSQIVAQRELQPAIAFHDRENRCDLGSRLWTSYVDPVLATQSHSTHRILRQIIAQFKVRIFQKARKFPPQFERSWHASCFHNRQSKPKSSNAVVGERGTQAPPRLDDGDAADDGGCHGESD